MPALRLIFTLACALAAAALLPAQTKPTGPRSGRWAHEDSALPPDPAVHWGRLDNGFRYAVLPHRGVPGRVAMKLLILTGSVDEKPAELGIAHFIEHMSFHGTRQMDEPGMLSLFRRAGLEYGSDVNAATTFDFTAYSLDFRDAAPGLLGDGVRWFRGVADGVLFDPADIDRERRVIFAEKRNRDSLADRQMMASFPVVFRGLRFANQIPIGTDRTLQALRRDHFLEFYRRGYRPDLMVFLAVGDFDPSAMEALVHTHFSQIPRPATPIPARDEGRADLRSLRAGVFRIPGVGSVETSVASVAPEPARPDSRETRTEGQRRQFVMGLFNERLGYMLPNFAAHEASYGSIMRHTSASASVRVAGEDWSDGLLGVDLAIRETLRRGFEAAEIEPLRQRQLTLATHMAEQVPVMDPVDLAGDLLDAITNHTVYLGPATDYAWMREWLQKLTLAEVNQTFRSLWAPEAFAFHIGGETPLQLTPAEVLKAVQKHRSGELPYLLPAPPRDIVFRLQKPGPISPEAEVRDAPELDARLIRFSNNVRLNLISNREEPGIVRVLVRVGGGLLTLPGRQPALKEFGLNTLLGSGTIYYQTDQLAQIIERRFLDFSFDVADHDAFAFRGTLGAENLETFLGLVTEIIRRPKFNPYAHKDERARAFLGRMSGNSGFGQGMREMDDYLFRGDARFMSGTALDYIALGVADVKRWMEEPLTAGYVEATIVGDIPEATARALAARTLGTLAPRPAEKTFADAPAPVEMTAPAGYHRIEFVGEMNVAMVLGNWPVTGQLDARAQAALQLLTKVVELRVRGEVRENLGLSYGPSASFQPFGGFENFALLRATVDCTPRDAERIGQAVADTADRLAREGVSEEEFAGARGILRGQLRRAFHDNEFLVNSLKRVQEKPTRLADLAALKDGLLDQVTREEVNTWAAQILPATNARTVALVPKAFVGLFDTAK